MMNFNTRFAKLFVLSSLSAVLAACGGGGGDSGSSSIPAPPANTDLFSVKNQEWKIAAVAGEASCYDFDTQKEISCENPDWDIKFVMGAQTPMLFTNSGVSGSGQGGALYSPFDANWTALLKEKNATQGGSIPASAWMADAYSNAFMDATNGISSFFEYDLFGDHSMSPNFKTFLVTTDKTKLTAKGTADSPVFAVQVVDYYRGSISGFIKLRYMDTLTTQIKELDVDASQGWSYVDLKTGAVSKQDTGVWQLAFNRYSVEVNSDAGVGAMVASQPAGFYSTDGQPIIEKFKDKNIVADTKADLLAAADLTVKKWGANTVTSILNPAYQGAYPQPLSYGWFNYYPTDASAQAAGLASAHMLKANPEAASMIRSNTGKSYARIHLKDLSYANPQDRLSQTTWTFEMDVQPEK